MDNNTQTKTQTPIALLFAGAFLATLTLLLGCPLHDVDAAPQPTAKVVQPGASFNTPF